MARSCHERESFRIRCPKNPVRHRAHIHIINVLKDLLRFLVNQIDCLLVFTMTDQKGELSVRRREIDFFLVSSSVVSSVVEAPAVSLTDGAGEAVGSSALTVYTMSANIAPKTQTANKLESFMSRVLPIPSSPGKPQL